MAAWGKNAPSRWEAEKSGGPTDLEVSCLDYHKQGREASSQRIGLKVSVGSGETVRGIRLVHHRLPFTPGQTYSQSPDTLQE